MNDLDEDYWSERYQEGQTGWDIGYASPQLIDFATTFPKDARILIPGAGNAYEAEALWKMGYVNVYVADLTTEPLQALQNRVPDFPSSQLIHNNFFEVEDQFDLILEQTFFCALDPSLRSDYASHMFKILAPGGKLGGLLFNFPLMETGPPFGGSEAEYRALFEQKFTLLNLHTSTQSIEPRNGKEFFFELEKKQ